MDMKVYREYIMGGILSALLISLACVFLSTGSGIAQENARRISMDFQDAPLKSVLKLFSQQAGLNFIAAEGIEDKGITLYLDGVTVQDALDSILKSNNLTYEQPKGSSIIVVKKSGKPMVDMVTKVYTLKYARLSESYSGDYGTDSSDSSSSGTGSSGSSSYGADSSGGEEGGYGGRATSRSDIKDVLEKLLSKSEGAEGAEGSADGSVVEDRRTNSLIVTSIPDDFPLIEETIRKLDVPVPQALIEAEIVELQTSALKRLGLEWGTTSTGTFVSFTGPIRSTKFPFIRKKGPFSSKLIEGISDTHTLGTLSLAEFALVVKALETEGYARYLAKPRIMALNNESAEIKITSDQVVGVVTTNQQDTGTITEEAERVETGISLIVTPTINEDGYITMTLEPEVSRAVQSPFFANFVDPAKRSARTTVMVRDGQTIAIGGLLKSDDVGDDRATPGLSNIPLIGNLFKRENKDKTSTELIIFITAHVVNDVSELTEEVAGIAEGGGQDASGTESAGTEGKAAIGAYPAEGAKTAVSREDEIKRTVIRLRKKREIPAK